jgi:hypothetical protein
MLSHSSVNLENIAPLPPPAILDPGPEAHHCLITGPRACLHLDPSLGACYRRPLPQAIHALLLVIVSPPPLTSTPPPLERTTTIDLDLASIHVAAILFLKPYTRLSVKVTPLPSIITTAV